MEIHNKTYESLYIAVSYKFVGDESYFEPPKLGNIKNPIKLQERMDEWKASLPELSKENPATMEICSWIIQGQNGSRVKGKEASRLLMELDSRENLLLIGRDVDKLVRSTVYSSISEGKPVNGRYLSIVGSGSLILLDPIDALIYGFKTKTTLHAAFKRCKLEWNEPYAHIEDEINAIQKITETCISSI